MRRPAYTVYFKGFPKEMLTQGVQSRLFHILNYVESYMIYTKKI